MTTIKGCMNKTGHANVYYNFEMWSTLSYSHHRNTVQLLRVVKSVLMPVYCCVTVNVSYMLQVCISNVYGQRMRGDGVSLV